jgi:hypothetical protein
MEMDNNRNSGNLKPYEKPTATELTREQAILKLQTMRNGATKERKICWREYLLTHPQKAQKPTRSKCKYLSGFCLTDSRLPRRDNTEELCG